MFHVQGSTASGVKAEASDSSKMDNGGGKSKCAIAVCTHLYLLALCRETNVTPLFWVCPLTYLLALLEVGKVTVFVVFLCGVFREGRGGVLPTYDCLHFVGRPT